MNELKPCPFCGGEAFINLERDCRWVECRECGAMGYVEIGGEAEAIEAWNTRPSRTCKPVEKDGVMRCPNCDYPLGIMSVPAYCAGCGAKVVSE